MQLRYPDSEPKPSWWRVSVPFFNGLPLWPQLFYLIRCGAWGEAIQLAKSMTTMPLLPGAVHTALIAHAAALLAAGAISVDEAAGTAFARAPSVGSLLPEVSKDALMDAVAQLRVELEHCERAASGMVALSSSAGYRSFGGSASGVGGAASGQSSADDPFRYHLLNMLACGSMDLLDETVLMTTEDFVWHRLFFVVTRDVSLTVRASDPRDFVAAAGLTLAQLASHITVAVGGDEYFDPGHTKPYDYCYVLLLVRKSAPACFVHVLVWLFDACCWLLLLLLASWLAG
jgi:hypothetical protein